MLKFSLDVRPLSVNNAFRGRRFKTPEAKQFDRILALILPKRFEPGPCYRVTYRFGLRQFGLSDLDNLLKCLQDCIVRKGIITDDRKITELHAFKTRSEKDTVQVEIESILEAA